MLGFVVLVAEVLVFEKYADVVIVVDADVSLLAFTIKYITVMLTANAIMKIIATIETIFHVSNRYKLRFLPKVK